MTYFVFVDFENVQKVDLALIEGKPVHVTLMIGKNQTWLDLTLVQQIRRLPHQVELLEVGASGHNALDLTLAYYLGRAVEQIPEATYAIVSKDKDFEPMIGHLVGKGINVVRKDTFAALPFLLPPKPAVPAKPKPVLKIVAGKPAPAAPKGPASKSAKAKPEDKLARLVKHLRNGPPTDRRKLEHTIADSYRKSPPPGGVESVIALLVKQKVIAIDAHGKVAVL